MPLDISIFNSLFGLAHKSGFIDGLIIIILSILSGSLIQEFPIHQNLVIS